jgi:hypothetical protein
MSNTKDLELIAIAACATVLVIRRNCRRRYHRWLLRQLYTTQRPQTQLSYEYDKFNWSLRA